jgi:hypothetical protein
MRAFRKRVRVQAYVEPELARRLVQRRMTMGAPESGIVRSSLVQYLDGSSDMDLLLRRLDRLGRADKRLQRDLELLSESFGAFLRTWFAHTPALPDDANGFARATAERRYRQLIEHVGQRFSGGRRFLDDLPHESIADAAELDAVRSEVDADRTGPR